MFARPGLCGTGIGRLGLVAASRNAFSPLSLFSAGEQGAWYDPSDMSTLFQDSAGTTPVTAVEQPVGLMLDKSSTAAPVATIVDPSFDNAARWSPGAGWAVTGGNAVATAAASNVNMLPSGTGYTATVSGAAYKATVDITSVTSGSISLIIWNGSSNVASSAIFTAPGTYQLIYTANNTQCRPYLTTNATNTTLVVASLTQVSVPGNHLIQPTATSRPTLSSRYNLFTESEFRNGLTDAPTRGGLLTATTLTGYAGALAFGHDGSATTYAYKSNFTAVVGITYDISVIVEMTDGLAPVFVGAADGATVPFALVLDNIAVNPAVYSVSLVSGNMYRVSGRAAATIGDTSFGVVKYNTNNNRTFKIAAYELKVASDAALPYQRVNTATDYDYDFSKFPPFLRFDGVDDSLYSAASVDFTSTDKMTVFAGVHKASDAAVGLLLELSASADYNAGGFYFVGMPSAATPWQHQTGPIGARTYAPYATGAAPRTSVLTSGFDNAAATEVSFRENGVVKTAAPLAVDGGGAVGNYGNYPLYVGRRNNASLPFNGRLYQLALKGKSMTAAEITTVESYINSKTKAY